MTENNRMNKIQKYTSDPSILNNINCVAFNQTELENLAEKGEKQVYLCNNHFCISMSYNIEKYIGIGEVTAYVICDIDAEITKSFLFDNLKIVEPQKNENDFITRFEKLVRKGKINANTNTCLPELLRCMELIKIIKGSIREGEYTDLKREVDELIKPLKPTLVLISCNFFFEKIENGLECENDRVFVEKIHNDYNNYILQYILPVMDKLREISDKIKGQNIIRN